MEQLEGRVAVITGGGSGIGEGFARVCHDAGMRVVVSDVEEAQAMRVANSIRELGGEAIGCCARMSRTPPPSRSSRTAPTRSSARSTCSAATPA